MGLNHIIRDLLEMASLELSPTQRSDLDRRLNGDTVSNVLSWEAERVQQVVQQGQIKNDDEWRVVERWLQHDKTAHSLKIEPDSYGEQVELLETLMMTYVRAQGNPDDRIEEPSSYATP